MSTVERWADVVGYEGRYEVSDMGRVRSLRFRGHNRVVVMKQSDNHGGYKVVTLRGKQYRVHCLVLEAFVGSRPDGMQGCHNDGDKSNCALSNLRWDTPKGNIADRDGYDGDRNPNAKLSNAQMLEVQTRRLAGEKCTDLATEFGISGPRVSQIARMSIDFRKSA